MWIVVWNLRYDCSDWCSKCLSGAIFHLILARIIFSWVLGIGDLSFLSIFTKNEFQTPSSFQIDLHVSIICDRSMQQAWTIHAASMIYPCNKHDLSMRQAWSNHVAGMIYPCGKHDPSMWQAWLIHTEPWILPCCMDVSCLSHEWIMLAAWMDHACRMNASCLRHVILQFHYFGPNQPFLTSKNSLPLFDSSKWNIKDH